MTFEQSSDVSRPARSGVSRREMVIGLGGLAIGAGTGNLLGARRNRPEAVASAAAVDARPTPISQERPGIVTLAGPAQKRINQLPAGPLYWQVETLPNLTVARAAEKPTGLVVEAERKVWLFTLTSRGERTPGGTHLAEIGPVQMGAAAEYLLQIAEQSRAPGNVGAPHTHPGIECWYIVAGEQRLRLPAEDRELRARAGEGMVGPPPNVPMQVLNGGQGERRAFNLFVLDSSQPTSKEGADIRTVDEAFKHAFQAGDLDATMALFADETVEISPFGIFPSRGAIRSSVETFIRSNPGFSVTFGKSEYVLNTAVHRVTITSDAIRASGVDRFILIHTIVTVRGRIAMLGQQLDLSDVETARYALALSPEGR
jgi:hypothetical protein